MHRSFYQQVKKTFDCFSRLLTQFEWSCDNVDSSALIWQIRLQQNTCGAPVISWRATGAIANDVEGIADKDKKVGHDVSEWSVLKRIVTGTVWPEQSRGQLFWSDVPKTENKVKKIADQEESWGGNFVVLFGAYWLMY
jgi:hypothetical protein